MDKDTDCPGTYDPSDRLVRAAALGNISVMRSLLMCNETDINHTDRDGRTSLFIASFHGRAEIADLLLSQPKIDVNKGRLSYSGPRVSNISPLFIAATSNKKQVVRDIISPLSIVCERRYHYTKALWEMIPSQAEGSWK